MNHVILDIIKSWNNTKGNVHKTEELIEWANYRQKTLHITIEKKDFSYDGFWYYDESDGYIRNRKNSFFQIAGYQEIQDDKVIKEQPVILQNEIGYLGILCKKIDGELNFLMQAKVEPGNVNTIQISPTIQATKSNFTALHGGKKPAYLEYFVDELKHKVVVDQIQSEQSSRFYKKRNRNILLLLDENEVVEELPSHRWMTLGQIKELMKIDNLVNMDTRTVLSCVPFFEGRFDEAEKKQIKAYFHDDSLYQSIFEMQSLETMHHLFAKLNDCKMYETNHSTLVPLSDLKSWDMTKNEIVCKHAYDFKVIFCNIEIEGREVEAWQQPLVEACGSLLIGLFTTVDEGVRKYLVKIRPEIGCFDTAELGPTVQLEPTNTEEMDFVETLFFKKMNEKTNVQKDVILSEEGGRFYHEQNRNVIIEIDKEELADLPKEYIWADFFTLSMMIQFNNFVNIQLRNLLSLVDL